MAARAYKHEEVAKTPAGYRVRSVKRGTHVVRVAFPPGRRRKGAGKVVEILHPKSETNPSCIVSNQARSNPGELLIFGNPSEKEKEGQTIVGACPHCQKMFTAAEVEGGKFRKHMADHRAEREKNPIRVRVFHDPAIKKFTAHLYDPKLGNLYGSGYTKKQAAQALRDVWRRERRQRGLNPSKLERQRGARERAARIRGARLNSVVWGNPKRKGEAKLTPEEDHAWVFAFNYYKEEGKTDLQADKLAARSGREIIRRLTGKSGKSPKENPWHPAGNFHSRAEADTRKRQLEAAGHTVMMVVSARGTKAENYSVLTRKPVTNPKRTTKRRRRTDRNPDETRAAVRLFEKFHGRDPKDITEKHVSAAMRKDYTALGDLEHLKVITPLGQTVQFYFEGDGVKLASSPDGKQLYCIGGNQNLTNCLDHASLEKDFVDLGECVQVQYLARKVHANFEPVSYYHKFGEKTGARPQLAYNKLQKQIYFVGGEYFIDTTQGVSPGIEN